MEPKKLGIAKLKYEIEGEIYSVRQPTLDEAEAYSESFNETEKLTGKERSQILLEYIAKLGIPVEVLRKISADDVMEILGDLSPKKVR